MELGLHIADFTWNGGAATRDEFLKVASGLRAAGFAATYVFAKGITEPEKITDLLGSAVPELA
jgi:hypothetical protein